ncbi:restriction endonuclease subunit S [Limosilactobacillus fermentum]|uniref:restriction endonuclease subunit S n=1 Tax=Limosilactobacillus fermentum TaxID=1613 RepID=UPI000DBFD843|nr:restriction endonuclease subunit S [Limosilactobacillus fermentum]RAM09501.1 restriction endonuclease subunit S [Limosilactobacillus fermentum]
MNKKELIPKRRFKEFENAGAWEQRRLGEVANFYSGGTPSVGVSDYYGGTIPFIRSAEINSSSTELYLSELGLQNSSAKMVNRGDILYALYGATSGEVGISKINGAINQAILAILPYKGYNSDFLAQWLRKNKEVIIRTYLQGGQGNLSGTIVKQIKISFPNFDEQKEIGKLFQKFDALIALHQRKLNKLKKMKSACLTEMFPAEGEREPKRRFPGFTGAWEQRKLGEVVEITMGQSPSSKNYTENPNDHILVQGNADMKNGHVVPRVWTTQITKQAEKGDLILSVRAPVGDIGKTDYDVVLGRGVAAIKGNSFIFQLLTKMKINGYWTRFSTGSTFESINSDNIKNAQISIPSLREQEKIGGLFNEFDSLIALHQRKLDKIKKMKLAYLNELFV